MPLSLLNAFMQISILQCRLDSQPYLFLASLLCDKGDYLSHPSHPFVVGSLSDKWKLAIPSNSLCFHPSQWQNSSDSPITTFPWLSDWQMKLWYMTSSLLSFSMLFNNAFLVFASFISSNALITMLAINLSSDEWKLAYTEVLLSNSCKIVCVCVCVYVCLLYIRLPCNDVDIESRWGAEFENEEVNHQSSRHVAQKAT